MVKHLLNLCICIKLACCGLLFAGCSSDIISEEERFKYEADDISICLKIAFPSIEEMRANSLEVNVSGLNEENRIECADLYLYEENEDGDPGDLISSFSSVSTVQGNGNSLLTFKSEYSDIEKIVGKKILIYVVANLLDYTTFNTQNKPISASVFFNEVGQYPLNLAGVTGNPVPMSNSALFEVDFTDVKSVDELLAYNSIVDLNRNGVACQLERIIARVDFKSFKNEETSLINHYKIGNNDGLYGKLTDIRPFNLRRESFIFPYYYHDENMSVEWFATPEIQNDSYNNNFLNAPVLMAGSQENYYLPFLENLTDLNLFDVESFSPWFYISENSCGPGVIPSMGNSTGIAFVFLITDKEGNILKGDNLKNLNLNISQVGETDFFYLTDAQGKLSLARGIIGNNEEISGFELIYYYFIKHKIFENGKSDRMVYAVKRNCVYRISVGGLNDLPRSFNPSVLLESSDTDIEIKSIILPWIEEELDYELNGEEGASSTYCELEVGKTEIFVKRGEVSYLEFKTNVPLNNLKLSSPVMSIGDVDEFIFRLSILKSSSGKEIETSNSFNVLQISLNSRINNIADIPVASLYFDIQAGNICKKIKVIPE